MKNSPTALYILFALQAFCALFFLADAVGDFLGHEDIAGVGDSDTFEYMVAAALTLSVIYTGRQILIMLNHQKRIENQLRAASSAFHELLEEHFDEWKLTPSERDVALLAIKGLSISEMAKVRETREGTVKTQCNAIYKKAGVESRTQLISQFVEELIEVPDRVAA